MNNGDGKEQKVDPARERLQNSTRHAFNTATGGAWNRVRNAPLVGKAARKAEDKVADKLGNSRLGKRIADPKNHKRPNLGAETKDEKANQSPTAPTKGSSGDVGSRNLRNSLTNKAKNLWNQRKKKKKGEKDDSGNGSDSSSENKEESENNSEEENSTELSPQESKRKVKIMLMLKIGMVAIAIFCLYFMIMLVAAAMTGGTVFRAAPIASYKEYGTDDFKSYTEEDNKIHEDEIKFYKKMEEIGKQNGEEVNTDYIVAILIEKYYEYDINKEYDTEEKFKELDEFGGIDYTKMLENVDKFVTIIKNTSSNDYEVGGTIYNAIKESDEFKEYYKYILEDNEEDDILEKIFEIGAGLGEETDDEETVMTTETTVTVTNQSTGSSSSSQTMPITDYISGSIYANLDSISNQETIKAYTIATATNIVAQNKQLTIDASNAAMTGDTCSIEKGCSYDDNGKLVDGPGKQNSKNREFRNGEYYYKLPLSSTASNDLTKSINSVFGNVLVNNDGTYPTVDTSKIVGFGDDYKTILKNSYGNYQIKNIGEGSYILDASYGDKLVKTNVIFYDQSDYPNQFCGIKGYTIKGSGCGVTSMAIVASTYENNKKYDPIWANDLARKNSDCGRDGTNYSHFTRVAKQMGYKSTVYSKNKANKWKISKNSYNNVLKQLSKGNLIIINVKKGHFTSGGHYMVLGGIDPSTKKVYVYDPNSKSNVKNRNTGSGWYSFNDIIVPESKAFIIIEKKG